MEAGGRAVLAPAYYAVWRSFTFSAPVKLYQVCAVVAPYMNKHERSLGVRLRVSSARLFDIGMDFG
ncbi:twin-arginine translocase subunit TatC [Salmonella enterica]|uniref:twin-arginine translocase subunit TatC n=1 Tax=Salmonella enterica TaxID=28901 RepID=UPI00398C76BB